MTAEETAILLLDRINVAIAGDMGDDFEIGHSLLWGVVSSDPADRWTALRRAWDRALFPQIIERYAGRNEALRDLLKIAAGSGTEAAFQERRTIGSDVPTEAALHLRPLLSLGEAEAKGVLRHLAL